MGYRHKPLHDQVIVITGASSGIGRATARSAARAGARVVVASRDEKALEELVAELVEMGTEALAFPMDVSVHAQHEELLKVAIGRFGAVDTWVNNAGVSIFGYCDEVALEDQRRLFETNFWGVVYGSLTALAHMRERGGAIINLGSEVSAQAIPMQGAYSASKHAVKGYTDSLRMEVQAEGLPVSLTLIRPASINTSFVQNAKNYMPYEPQLPPPLYDPQIVADAILFAARSPRRDIYVGGASKLISAASHRIPGLIDRFFGPLLIRQQRTRVPSAGRGGALFASRHRPLEQAPTDRTVLRHSAYTKLTTEHGRPALIGIGVAMLVVAGTAMIGRRKR